MGDKKEAHLVSVGVFMSVGFVAIVIYTPISSGRGETILREEKKISNDGVDLLGTNAFQGLFRRNIKPKAGTVSRHK